MKQKLLCTCHAIGGPSENQRPSWGCATEYRDTLLSVGDKNEENQTRNQVNIQKETFRCFLKEYVIIRWTLFNKISLDPLTLVLPITDSTISVILIQHDFWI